MRQLYVEAYRMFPWLQLVEQSEHAVALRKRRAGCSSRVTVYLELFAVP